MKLEKGQVVKFDDLVLRFYTYAGVVEALDGVNLYLKENEVLGVVGETGCGKSVTALALMGIVLPPGKIEGGQILFDYKGKQLDMLHQKQDLLRGIRGHDISMVFQEPRAYLNPVYNVEFQITEVIMVHRKKEFAQRVLDHLTEEYARKGESLLYEADPFLNRILKFNISVYKRMAKNPNDRYARFLSKIPIARRFGKLLKEEVHKEVIGLLRDMQIADPERVAHMYPHELSGGMAQRMVIAMALACDPKVLICDEPTTNLDVTVQAQILELVSALKQRKKASILYITHDLGVVAQLCDRVVVMYAGNAVEMGEVHKIFAEPIHPYTQALLESIPAPGKPLKSIPGTVPSLINPIPGCRFHDRCRYAMDVCREVKPQFVEVKENHYAACFLYYSQNRRS
jgi:peptide/nickel transport system ATP-binding protein